MKEIKNFIGGEFREPASGRYLDNVEPATGEVYSRVAASNETDVARAVEAATGAFPTWSTLPARERSRIMMRLADIVEDNLEALARAESIDNGKPVAVARSVDIPRAVANIRFFATAILHTASEAHVTDDVAINYTLRRPLGAVGLISPWNLPLYLFTWKLAPAIATGNTAVAKPSEVTPMTAFLFSEFLSEAGVPPGVLNIVHGTGSDAGSPLVSHDQIRAISFTGGTATGSSIARATAGTFRKLSLEMGGKNPNVVFADADLDAALPGSVRSSFANQGEICLCGSRILIESDVYDQFVDRFVSATRALRIGDPLDEATDVGAIVSEPHLAKIESYVDLARKEGGDILTGGKRPETLPERCANGYFLEPTVITGLAPGCRVNQEEIFGPVVSLVPFDGEDEAIDIANSTRYGLSASVWTSDVKKAHRVADRIQAGTVWVNCWMLRDLRVPFGGTKDSGVGREGGQDALNFFTEPKNVCVYTGEA